LIRAPDLVISLSLLFLSRGSSAAAVAAISL
jgi:hypothetical protein